MKFIRYSLLNLLIMLSVVLSSCMINDDEFDYIKEVKAITIDTENVYAMHNKLSKRELEKILTNLQPWKEIDSSKQETIEINKIKHLTDRYQYAIGKPVKSKVSSQLQILLNEDMVDWIAFSFDTNDKEIADKIYTEAFHNLNNHLNNFEKSKGKYGTTFVWEDSRKNYDVLLSIVDRKKETLEKAPPFNEWDESNDAIYQVTIDIMDRAIRQ